MLIIKKVIERFTKSSKGLLTLISFELNLPTIKETPFILFSEYMNLIDEGCN